MTLRNHHLASLDAFRGLAVAGMIMVNSPGNWNSVFTPLAHSDWNGCTVADMVFPFFVFILGAAMPFAFGRRIDHGHQHRDLHRRVVRRALLLMALGLLLNVASSAPDVMSLRFPGVLQRIAVVYAITAFMVLHLSPKGRAVAIVVLAVGHWALLAFTPFGGGPPGIAEGHNLAAFIDRGAFGRHILTTAGDPEGILGTLPAVAGALLGASAGDWLRQRHTASAQVRGLASAGAAALIVGCSWATVLPLNKFLWTGSFVLFTGGIASLSLAVLYFVMDLRGHRGWARPFVCLGLNPLAIYFCSELARDLLDRPWVRVAGHSTTPRSWLFWNALKPLMPHAADEWASLAFAALTVGIWATAACAFERRGIRIQV